MQQPQSVADLLLKQKKKMLDSVRERFARYGDKPCKLIKQAAFQPHGMMRLIERLGLSATPHFDQQLDALSRYLSERGPVAFVKRLEEAAAGSLESVGTPNTKDDAEAPEQNEPAQTTAVAEPEKPLFDAQHNYIGPERRSGDERRSGVDRRASVETINTNKRYGGDRRRTLRREADRLRLALED